MAKNIPPTPSLPSMEQPAAEPAGSQLEREFEKVIHYLRQDIPKPRPPAVRAILSALKSKSSLAMEED